MDLYPFEFSTFTTKDYRVQCLVCGKFINSGVLDRDGPAFRAYYCTEHAPKEPHEKENT